MKYDADYTERLLENLEDLETDGYEEPIQAFADKEFRYYRLLIREGLVVSSGEPRETYVQGLTLQGHLALKALRQEHRWPRFKRLALQLGLVVLGSGIVQAAALAWSYWGWQPPSP